MSNDIYLQASVKAILPSGKEHLVKEVYETTDVSAHSIEARLSESVYTASFFEIKTAYLQYLNDNAAELTKFIWPADMYDDEIAKAEIDYYFGDGEIEPLNIITEKDYYAVRAFERFIEEHSQSDGWELKWCFK